MVSIYWECIESAFFTAKLTLTVCLVNLDAQIHQSLGCREYKCCTYWLPWTLSEQICFCWDKMVSRLIAMRTESCMVRFLFILKGVQTDLEITCWLPWRHSRKELVAMEIKKIKTDSCRKKSSSDRVPLKPNTLKDVMETKICVDRLPWKQKAVQLGCHEDNKLYR